MTDAALNQEKTESGSAAHENRRRTLTALITQVLGNELEDLSITEITVNEPGGYFVEGAKGWEARESSKITDKWLRMAANATAAYTEQHVSEKNPILSATWPTGHRVQVVMPPAVRPGTISFTIRRSSDDVMTLQELEASGYFSEVKVFIDRPEDDEFTKLLRAGQYVEFFERAVPGKLNILTSGATGSGKTTFLRTLLRKIPAWERLISVENVDEMRLYETHKNSVAVFYSAGNQGTAQISSKECMESSLRMFPSRILVAELIRAEEAQFFLRNVNSGHPGSMSSLHANNTELALEQLGMFLRETAAGSGLTRDEMMKLIRSCVQVVCQCAKIGPRQYRLKEIRYV